MSRKNIHIMVMVLILLIAGFWAANLPQNLANTPTGNSASVFNASQQLTVGQNGTFNLSNSSEIKPQK